MSSQCPRTTGRDGPSWADPQACDTQRTPVSCGAETEPFQIPVAPTSGLRAGRLLPSCPHDRRVFRPLPRKSAVTEQDF